MTAAGGVVLAVHALLLGSALLALLGRADRSRLIVAWVAMVGFAAFASFWFWEGVQLRRSVGPVTYDLRSASEGPQKVTLYRTGVVPGYRGRLVRRKDRSFDKELGAKLGIWSWKISICENLALKRITFDQDGVFEFESELSDVVLQYEATPETRPLLEEVVLELTCPGGFRKGMAQQASFLNSRMGMDIVGLLLAAVGAGVQRRKMRRLSPTTPVPSTSDPRSP
jgi:hypothetical protein